MLSYRSKNAVFCYAGVGGASCVAVLVVSFGCASGSLKMEVQYLIGKVAAEA